MTDTRKGWPLFFLEMAEHMSTRATCSRLHAGCVITSQSNVVLSTGYNGAPRAMRHCNHENDGDMYNGHCAVSVHAEINAIAQAAKYSIPLDKGTAYINYSPCRTCFHTLINAGIQTIIYKEPYRDISHFKGNVIKVVQTDHEYYAVNVLSVIQEYNRLPQLEGQDI